MRTKLYAAAPKVNIHPTTPVREVLASSCRDYFHPTEDLFHALALYLADGVACVSSGSTIYRAAAILVILRYLRRRVEMARLRYKILGVVILIRAHSHRMITRNGLDQDQCGVPLRRPIGLQYLHIGYQSVAILH